MIFSSYGIYMADTNDSAGEQQEDAPANQNEFEQLDLGETLSSIGRIAPRSNVTEAEESYLSYAMSVIVSPALPDALPGVNSW